MSEKEAAETALDRVSAGVVMLDTSGRAIFVNRTAKSICAELDGLSITSTGLRAASKNEDALLQQHIASAIRTTIGGRMGAGGALAVTRKSGNRAYRAIVSPVGRCAAPFGLRQPAALVFISAAERAAPPPSQVLRDLYGLTGAEARLLAALLQGDTLQDYAERRAVTINTVRTLLARIFSKTGTARQAELIRVCLCEPVVQVASGEKSTLRELPVSRKK